MIYNVLFLNQNTRNSKIFFLAEKKKSHLSARVMTRIVQLLTHEAYFLLRLKSGQLIANQIWEFCDRYDYILNHCKMCDSFKIWSEDFSRRSTLSNGSNYFFISAIFTKNRTTLTDWMTFDTFLFLVDIQRPFDIFNNYSSSLNGLWVNSPWGLSLNGLLTQRPRGREE